jgi:hypothetical protein
VSKLLTTHLTVNASVEDVWHALTDLEGYRDWNPFINHAIGVLEVGQRLKLRMQPPGGRAMTFKPWVTAVEEHRYLEWLGRLGMPGLFDGRHSFSLTPLPGGRALLQQSETFTGVLVPFAGSILTPTRAGFEAMNEALGQRAVRLRH